MAPAKAAAAKSPSGPPLVAENSDEDDDDEAPDEAFPSKSPNAKRRDQVFDTSQADFRRGSLYIQRRDALLEQTGLSIPEFDQAVALFEDADQTNDGVLTMDEVDLLFRKLKLWLSTIQLVALAQEVDEDCNGTIELDEFCMMLAKIRGKRPLSPEYFIRQLPRKIREQFTKVFRILDSDQNGCLSRDEARSGLEHMNVMITSDEQFDLFYKEIDIDGNGTVDVDEFLILMAKHRGTVPQLDTIHLHLSEAEMKEYRGIFDAVDVDKSGSLSTHELHQLFMKLGYAWDIQTTHQKVCEVDLNGSGKVDIEEFLFMLVKMGLGTKQATRSIFTPGGTYEEAFSMGVTLDLLWDLGYDDVRQLRLAGWTAGELYEMQIANLWDLREGGFTATELRRAGWGLRDLKLSAGYSMSDLRVAGFSAEAIRRCTQQLRTETIDEEAPVGPIDGQRLATVRGMPLLKDGFPDGGDEDCRPQTAPNAQNRWWSTPRLDNFIRDAPNRSSSRPVTALTV